MHSFENLNIPAKIDHEQFDQLERDLMIRLDALDGVITEWVEEPDQGPDAQYQYPTRRAFVRDATNAIPLEKRLEGFSHEHSEVLAINQLLRALNVIRSILHAIEHKEKSAPNNPMFGQAKKDLKEQLIKFQESMRLMPKNANKYNFKEIEATLHTNILKNLTALNMTNGLTTPAGYADLLEHYRNLSSVLRPARSYVTKVNHTLANGDVIQYIDAAHPITKKTAIQKQQLDLIGEEKPEQPNYFSASINAFQQATSAFKEELKRDDTALPAQTRSTIAPSAKNAFVVHNQLVFPDGTKKDMYALRTASTGYIGNGETTPTAIAYGVENIKQLQEAARVMTNRSTLYFTLLLTDSFWNKQSRMIELTRKAGKELGVSTSLLPINMFGVAHAMEIAPEVYSFANQVNRRVPDSNANIMNMVNKKIRTANASQIIDMIAADPAEKAIPIVGCASGQDRTATALEVATILWTEFEFMKRGITLKLDEIAYVRALGCHNAMMATLSAPGSAGLKKDSVPHYFPQLITDVYYRDTADTNKDPAIEKAHVAKLLRLAQPSYNKDLTENFNKNVLKVSTAQNVETINQALVTWANAALHYQNSKYTTGVGAMVGSAMRLWNKGSNEEEGMQIRHDVTRITEALADSQYDHVEERLKIKLDQMLVEIERLSDAYPAGKQGTVFQQLEQLVRAADNRLQILNPSQEEKSSANPNP
jgi:hypothetical protein